MSQEEIQKRGPPAKTENFRNILEYTFKESKDLS